ncbi:MAG: TonB family protein [Bacteroidota bacterium]
MKRIYFGLILMSVVLSVSTTSYGQSLKVHSDVDKAPKFKGKPSNIEKFFDKHMAYPKEARLEIIEGVVEVSFVVSDEGKLVEPNIEKSVDPLLDDEALRLVALMQDWKPARKDGEVVDAKVTVPVRFQLSDDDKAFMKTLQEHGLTDKMPLFVIDDKIVKEYVEVPHYMVKSIRVMKGEKAIDRYGEAARNGVVIVKTKPGTPPVR